MPSPVQRYTRRGVGLPDGSTAWGRLPGTSAVVLEEHRLRDVLARQLGGVTEAALPYGRADVMTAAAVFEVEPYRTWRNGVRQVLAYSAQCGLPPALALFGPARRDDVLGIYLRLRGNMFRPDTPPGRIELWWWAGHGWEHIASRKACTVMPGGATFTNCWHCRRPIVSLRGQEFPSRLNYRAGHPAGVHHCPGLCASKHLHELGEDGCPYWEAVAEQAAARRAARA